jgi:hypothetical protein
LRDHNDKARWFAAPFGALDAGGLPGSFRSQCEPPIEGFVAKLTFKTIRHLLELSRPGLTGLKHSRQRIGVSAAFYEISASRLYARIAVF